MFWYSVSYTSLFLFFNREKKRDIEIAKRKKARNQGKSVSILGFVSLPPRRIEINLMLKIRELKPLSRLSLFSLCFQSCSGIFKTLFLSLPQPRLKITTKCNSYIPLFAKPPLRKHKVRGEVIWLKNEVNTAFLEKHFIAPFWKSDVY